MNKQELKQFNTEKVLQSAVHFFVNHGFYETSLNDIAEHAGTTIRSISRYFGNKENLIAKAMDILLEKAYNELSVQFEQVLQKNTTGYEQLLEIMQIRIDYSKNQQRITLSIIERESYCVRKDINSEWFGMHVKNDGYMRDMILFIQKGLRDRSIWQDIDIEHMIYLLDNVFKAILRRVAVAYSGSNIKEMTNPEQEIASFTNFISFALTL
ncbi:TetR/AcrR family transcriptional regulator [Eubacterium aggregans]|uniref:TetR/AcrR family transcriptional regulator n=1 Tax=Eubacterium aggregans TaxID=81409 RepID=UPI003F2DE640